MIDHQTIMHTHTASDWLSRLTKICIFNYFSLFALWAGCHATYWFEEPQSYGQNKIWLIFFLVNHKKYHCIPHKKITREMLQVVSKSGIKAALFVSVVQKIWKVLIFIFCMPIQLSYWKTCLQAYLWCTVFKCLAKMYQLKS